MVGEIGVIYTPEVIQFLDDLVITLYKEEYFGFIESAEEYVSNIYDAVSERIKKFPQKKTPYSLQYLGADYIFYKSNSRTTWYIFFEKRNQNYLITGILNNHNEEAKEL
ncbi:hypothetical protein [Flavobacterium quisquiliarum]|jgi:hypothetical protein|uniref:Plasmid stabilization system protein ParE n=1 Tax=Flavobacterium quisquiliarum TaxID=1834436 RepID=A0ABV8W5V1_9FLAO|nr:hypothetical protein [Flavobacterium quisquiliarum]MBW1657048.1 hypothetical protein [Flavobacterium quisquiliarum]NWK99714.1 hypothetical protein [Flavobacterium collinsii]